MRTRRNKTLGIWAFALMTAVFLNSAKGFCQEMSARDMMQKSSDNQDTRDEVVSMEMTLMAKGGGERSRRLVMKRMKTASGLDKIMIRFQEPADIRGTSLLTWEQKGRDDDQWIYLPALKQTKRIGGGSDKQGSFVGSDLTYEDLRPEKLDNFQYTKVGDEPEAFVIEAVPVKPEDTGYSKRKLWLKKDNFLQISAEYYDKKGTLLKTAKSSDFVTIQDGKVRANRVEVKNAQTEHSTVLKSTDRKINTGLSESDFTTNELEKGV